MISQHGRACLSDRWNGLRQMRLPCIWMQARFVGGPFLNLQLGRAFPVGSCLPRWVVPSILDRTFRARSHLPQIPGQVVPASIPASVATALKLWDWRVSSD